MDARYIAAAIPIFFAMIGLERWVNGRQGDPRYAFHDSITNLSCGIGQQVIGVFYRLAILVAYTWVWAHARVFTISAHSVAGWVAVTFGVDLGYYAFHRASHRVNFIWAGHIVHHQSEEYNLSVALRQSWFVGAIAWVFYLPLAVVGFPPVMFVTMTTLNTLYQFWIHTRAVGKMWRPIEWVMNTPSHHRVHHGIDPKYIDKNYAGAFIIWDRFFGTFQPEESEPVYGVVKPLHSWNPAWANVEHFATMWRITRATKRWRDRLAVPFMPPEWRPRDLGGPVTIPPVARATQRKYAVLPSHPIDGYVVVNFIAVAIATTAFILVEGRLPLGPRIAVAAVIVSTLVVWGGLVEARGWSVVLEGGRLAAMVLVVAWLARATPLFWPSVATTSLVAIVALTWVARARARAPVEHGTLERSA